MSRKPPKLPAPAPPRLSPRAVAAAALAVFAVLVAIYHATVIPTVVDQDSGELVAAAHVLGIAHPTGYPLWVLLGRLFDFLPIGGASAYRVAMLSVICAAAAGATIVVLAARLTDDLALAMVAGLAFGLWYPVWSQAVLAEVYGLTALLVALSLAAALKWHDRPSSRALAWLALACGFVSMHHRTAMLAVAPALLTAAALTRPRRLRTLAGAAALFLAPFLFYAYIPIRAAARPPLNWTDPSTPGRFLDHVLATQYTHFAFSHDLDEMLAQAAKLTPEFLAASPALAWLLALLGLPPILWGAWRWLRRQPSLAWPLAVGSLGLVVWVLQWGETSDLKVFFQPLGCVLALCGAVGLAEVKPLAGRPRTGRALGAGVGAVICLALLAANWARADMSNMWEHRDRWVAALSQMEPDAVFISNFDVPTFATLYLQHVEGLRQDVVLLRAVRMPDDWYVELIADPDLRTAARDAWQAASQTTMDLHDRTALFAYYLARLLAGRRTVYCLHPPVRLRLPGPPHFVNLSEDLVALRPSPPDTTPRVADGPPLAEFPAGVALTAFEWDRDTAGAGEMVGFRASWRLRRPLPPVQLGLRLLPESADPEEFSRRLLRRGRFVQGFPVLYGQWGMEPTGDAVSQRGQAIMPSNAPPGEYRVSIGIGPPYAQAYEEWTEVGRIAIEPRPLPSNPP